ncbi:Ti-type conjugative transfer relaxase TraA [Afifella sp. H1R]|nr:Ti-type conjugative transfer relaxase TraA [Afifella sp. H1R]
MAAAAYRSASELHDERLGRAHDFTAKTGVVHSEILAPDGAPERLSDRAALWNEVEATEKRKDAQLAREVEFALPRELNREEGVQLARDFVQREFVDRGMVADLNVHWDFDAEGQAKPHAHVMLTMREVGPDGFGKKVREWNATPELTGWRERWAEHVNQRCAELGHDVRIDHRTLAAQGVELEPQHKIGPAGMRRETRGEDAERAQEHRDVARRNGERLLAEPGVALRSLTHQHSTFTRQDLARFVHRQTDGADQFQAVMSRVESSPEIVQLGQDGRGRERFTTREIMAVEQRMEQSADSLADGRGHRVSRASLAHALDAANDRGMVPGQDQVAALAHVTGDQGLALVVGYAGTGKSAMLGVAREAWEREGYIVRGAALSGIAAEGLEGGSGIASRTIASLEYAWERGRDELTSRDVLVIDEAGMIGSRQMARVLEHAEKAGAKVVLVGDPEQLQAIEAGAAFRALSERHGAAEITEIRRQRVDWQRDATRELATGRTGQALDRYEAAGMVHGHATREDARTALVERWNEARQAQPDQSQVILAYTRADVRELNAGARSKLQDAGELGADHAMQTERGERSFATGDRLMFLRNERSMEVKNGTLGTVEGIERAGEGKEASAQLTVRLDGEEGRRVAFELRDYDHIDHGYAATVHKAQGVTVDRAHVLATGHMDRHAAYVGLSRHREGVELHYGREDMADHRQLVRTLARERAKDVTLDYPTSFAERRGITPENEIRVPERVLREAAAPERERTGQEPPRGIFAGLQLGKHAAGERSAGEHIESAAERGQAADRRLDQPGMFAGVRFEPEPEPEPEPEQSRAPAMRQAPDRLSQAAERYGRAWADTERMRAQDLPVLPHQSEALDRAAAALDKVRPSAAQDLASALKHDPHLRRDALERPGEAQGAQLVAGIDRERGVRLGHNPELKAERIATEWGRLEQAHGALAGWQDKTRGQIEAQMKGLAQEIKGNPQLEAVMRSSAEKLGITQGSSLDRVLREPNVAQAIERTLSRGLSRDYGMER